jgi:hypothetical protein
MLAPFQASRLKIARARQHTEELRTAVAAFLDTKPYQVAVETPSEYRDLACKALVVRVRKPVPPELSAIIGDVIHNLRTALDLLANDLVRLAGKNPKEVYFPFARSEDELSEQIKRRNFDRAGPDAVALLKQLCPYKGGNVALRTIHDLDIQDKHQALVPVAHGLSIDFSGIADREAANEVRRKLANWSTRVVRDGQTVAVLPTG